VLVHGLLTSRTMWRPQVAALEAAEAIVVAPDLPGHGLRHDAFTIDAAMATIDDAIDALPGHGPVVLVGLSLGGYLVMEYAGRHHERIDGLIPMACTTPPITFGLDVYRAISTMLIRQGGRAVRTQRLAQTIALGPEGAEDMLAGGFSLSPALDALNAVAQLDPITSVHRAASAGTPIWFVSGQFDQMRLGEHRFWRAAPRAWHTIVPFAPHIVSLANPVGISRLLTHVAKAITDGALQIASGPDA